MCTKTKLNQRKHLVELMKLLNKGNVNTYNLRNIYKYEI